jgi:DNA repair exonuclease SbcCD nuclease subunit
MILMFGDLHFAPGGAVTEFGYTEREMEALDTCQWIAEAILLDKPRVVVCMGDTGHNNSLVEMSSLSAIAIGFTRIRTACDTVGCKFVILSGNHDQFSDDGSISLVNALKPYGHVVENYAVIDGVAFLSFYSDLQGFIDDFGRILGVQTLCMHQDVVGAQMNANRKSDFGVYAEQLKEVPNVFNGHYHKPHVVGHVTMVGSACYHNFSDQYDRTSDDQRGIVLFDEEKRTIDRIANPHTSLYQTVELPKDLDPSGANMVMANLPKGRVNLRIKGTPYQIEWIRKGDWSRYELKSMRLVPLVESSTVEVKEGSQQMTPGDAIGTFVDNVETDLDRSKLKASGLQYLGR